MKDLIRRLEAERDAILAGWTRPAPPRGSRSPSQTGTGGGVPGGWPRVANFTAATGGVDPPIDRRRDAWWGRLRDWIPAWPF